jgi:hypothetical protein
MVGILRTRPRPRFPDGQIGLPLVNLPERPADEPAPENPPAGEPDEAIDRELALAYGGSDPNHF